ncbi:ECF RNA polymerase sigma factor SigK [Nocardioides cynanchi]|uniref:ECF RNA polymerase sigma factor SigK n=1 Tax=Nocardioides cynanchi TaxID=2558918 RepID=UPI00124534CE|nr:ECF RNA polymerase sigma factor SigK [Nocardioides cynanchi]
MNHLASVPTDPPAEGGGSGGAHLAELLKRSSRGDEAAFAEWYDATASRAFGLAVRVLRDRAQAEEVVQEVYLDCWRSSARFDDTRGSAISWLLTIVHRKSVDRVRSAEAASRRDTTYTQQEQTVDHDSTAESATASLEASRVRAALDHLTIKQRQAIELAFLGGYTHTEVATMLDLPVGTTKTRIRDGLIRLRDALGVGEVAQA